MICAGRAVKHAVGASKAIWARHLRKIEYRKLGSDCHDLAFCGKYSLLATDQGIRGLLQTTNDICFIAAKELHLDLLGWNWESVYSGRNARRFASNDEGAVNLALDSLQGTEIGRFLVLLGQAFGTYDWRLPSTPGLTEEERLGRTGLRGSSGYKEIRHRLFKHIAKTTGAIGNAARHAMEYEA